MPRSAPYDELLTEILRDKERAIAYLNAALEENDPRVFLIALRNVTQAQGGIARVAAHSGLNRESLYRALSEKGNPSVQTLTAVLAVLGARLDVTQMTRRKRSPLCSFTAIINIRPILRWSRTPVESGVQLAAA